MKRTILTSTICALWFAFCSLSAEATAQGPSTTVFSETDLDFFEKKVRPLLIEHCLKCHGRDPKQIKGGLNMTARAGVLQGGESGPAVVPGKPEQSLLLEAVRYELLEMPPGGKLSAEEIDTLVEWVKRGLPDTRSGSRPRVTAAEINLEEGRKFWAFQPPRKTNVPEVRDTGWPTTTIDRYLIARLESEGLKPVADAGRPALIRRAYFALVGLPPTPNAIDAFASDPAPLQEAFAKIVDRLLASPLFGERWGRHWLDVARFAESSGGGRSLMFKDAWRYRDYVIGSYNDDKPFDQFIHEQIAGDLLPHNSPPQRAEQLIATGFLALGPTNYEQQDKALLRMEVIDEQIDTMGRAFLGLTLGCARCHDHKFDPIPMRDYYALAGIFGSTKSLIPGNVSGYVEQPLPAPAAERAARKAYQQQVDDLNKQLAEAQAELQERKGAEQPDDQGIQDALQTVERINEQLEELKKAAPKPEAVAMSVQDEENPSDGPLHIRGGVRNLGPLVPRGFISVAMSAPASPPAIEPGQSGRLELARWIASRDNPLTARVYVNRVWRHLFGAGLVATLDNHGQMGPRPTHPELLDHLALQFIANGWSTKKLIRRMMLSHVYRLSTQHNDTAFTADDRNRLLWRASRRRLDAEVIRDAILLVSGQLDLAAGGLTIKKISQYDLGYEFDTVRRSVYVPAFRNAMLELFEVFDFANPNLVIGQRTTSTLPTQALYLMNSPFVLEQARHAAERLLGEQHMDDADRINLAFRRALGRLATQRERSLALQYLGGFSPDDPEIEDRLEAWSSLCHALFASLDFRYVD